MSAARKFTFQIASQDTPVYIDDPSAPVIPMSQRFCMWETKVKKVRIPRKDPVLAPEKIYELFKHSKYFHLDYFCMYTNHNSSIDRYIYVVFKDIIPRGQLGRFQWDNMRLHTIREWKSTKFEGGEIIFERGDRPKAPAKKRRITPNEVVTPSTSDPGPPQIDPSDTMLVEDKHYVRYMNAPGPLPIFHAVWGATDGMWRPMFWVGPTSSIEPTPRRGKEPETTTELLNVQGNSCAICHSDVSLDIGKSNCDVDHLVPLHLGGSNSIKNLQVLCVPCHRRKSALERRKVRTNSLVPTSIKMEPGSVYIARDDMAGSICEPIDFQERNPKEFLESGEDGIFKLIY